MNETTDFWCYTHTMLMITFCIPFRKMVYTLPERNGVKLILSFLALLIGGVECNNKNLLIEPLFVLPLVILLFFFGAGRCHSGGSVSTQDRQKGTCF